MSGKAEGGSCKSLKILAVGDVKGRISDLVKRLKTVNKKAGPFDMVRSLLPQFLQFLVYAEITRDLAGECSSFTYGMAKYVYVQPTQADGLCLRTA